MFAAAMAVLLTFLAVAASVAIYPEATGDAVYQSGGATVDASNIDQGYVMVRMSSSKKLKVRITGANQYTYDLDGDGEYDVYPLQDGNRDYTLVVYEQVQGNSYSQVLSRTLRPQMADENAPFPIEKDVIEGYFDASDTPAYVRMADLLEDVYKNPPRDDPFAPPFRPHFNWLKFFALAGVHAMYAVHLDPKAFSKLCPPFARFAGRIYGYVAKAHVPRADAAAMEEKIRRFLPGAENSPGGGKP